MNTATTGLTPGPATEHRLAGGARRRVRLAVLQAVAAHCTDLGPGDTFRAGGLVSAGRHLDRIVDIARRVHTDNDDALLFQVLDDICTTCRYQSVNGHCNVHGIGKCTLTNTAGPALRAAGAALREIGDAEYLAAHSAAAPGGE